MKKIYLLGSLAVLLGLSGCKDNDYNYNYQFTVPTVNILTNVSDGTGVASKVTYDYEINDNSGTTTGTISSSAIVLGGSSYTLKTVTAPYQYNSFTVAFKNVTGSMTGNQTIPVSNGNFTFTTVVNNPLLLGLSISTQLPQQFAICQYKIGDEYTVKTFPEIAFYTGETTTQYPGADGMQENSTKTIFYELSLNLAENKATIYMYNAKFSGMPQEPSKSQINIEGLNVDYSNGMVTVTGENIIPVVVEGNVSTPYENYIFNNIEFKTTSDDLSECQISYTVAGRFSGTFKGSYIYGNRFVASNN